MATIVFDDHRDISTVTTVNHPTLRSDRSGQDHFGWSVSKLERIQRGRLFTATASDIPSYYQRLTRRACTLRTLIDDMTRKLDFVHLGGVGEGVGELSVNCGWGFSAVGFQPRQ